MTKNSEINDFIENFKEILDEPDLVDLNDQTLFKHIDEWDSLASLSLMAMVDSEYNIKLSADEINKCEKIVDLFNIIKTKIAKNYRLMV